MTRIYLIHLCFDVQQQYIIENVIRVEVDLGISGANLLDVLFSRCDHHCLIDYKVIIMYKSRDMFLPVEFEELLL